MCRRTRTFKELVAEAGRFLRQTASISRAPKFGPPAEPLPLARVPSVRRRLTFMEAQCLVAYIVVETTGGLIRHPSSSNIPKQL